MINTPRTIGNAHKREIINLLRREGNMSRMDIARSLHLSPPAITGNIASLLECGMIQEVGVGCADMGRKPVLIAISPDFCKVIGVDIREKMVRAVTANFVGEIQQVHEVQRGEHETSDELMQTIFRAIDFLLKEDPAGQMAAIVVSVPGIVDQFTGKILLSTIVEEWGENNLKYQLEQKYGMLVDIENDVDMAICGEAGFGDRFSDMIYIKVGGGTAARAMVDGNLIRGRMNMAGEIGYMLLDLNVEQDGFQSRGALERAICNKAIDERYRSLTNNCDEDYYSIKKLIALSDSGDEVAVNLLKVVLDYVSRVIVNMESVLDIDHVVLGEDLEYLSEVHLDVLKEFIGRYIPHVPEITTCRFGEMGEITGCVISAINMINEEIDRFLE